MSHTSKKKHEIFTRNKEEVADQKKESQEEVEVEEEMGLGMISTTRQVGRAGSNHFTETVHM